MKQVVFFISILTVISGCGTSEPKEVPSQIEKLQLVHFAESTLSVPKDLTIRPSASTSHQIADNDTNDNDLDEPQEYRIELWLKAEKACSPSVTGASQTAPLPDANGKAEWGRVDFYDSIFEKEKEGGDYILTKEGGDNIICTVPDTTGIPPPSVYAFCSQHDNKTVIICINQMTDNEKQAKEIFETFRWTDESR